LIVWFAHGSAFAPPILAQRGSITCLPPINRDTRWDMLLNAYNLATRPADTQPGNFRAILGAFTNKGD